jgi:hypothetical protein
MGVKVIEFYFHKVNKVKVSGLRFFEKGKGFH